MIKKKPKFLRTDYHQYSKLGVRRKKKQVYRKGKGGENKQRLKMKGHLRNISIGFRGEKKTRNLVNGLAPATIRNMEDIKKLKQGEIGLVAKIGAKKKMEIAQYAFKNAIKLLNLNAAKFLEKAEHEKRLKEEEKSEKEKKKKEREKKAAEKEKKEENETQKETKNAEEVKNELKE
jgi:large subunit ribosomal protein L32e